MNYTSIEQSKKLLELGLNPESADMYYEDDISVEIGHPWHEQHIPCWSVGALMKLLPSEISTGDEWHNKYQIDIRKYDRTFYQIAFGNDRGLSGSWHDRISTKECDNLLDACFNMICWLLENGYIKKE